MIPVEFQPSGWAKGTYCNVGFDVLWFERDHLVFEDAERIVTDAGQFAAADAPPGQFEAEVESMVGEAAASVERRRASMGADDPAVLEWLARRSGNVYDDYHAGAARGLLGRRDGAVDAFRSVLAAEDFAPWVAAVKEQAATLGALLDDQQAFRTELADRVARTRAAVRLTPAPDPWKID